MGGWPSTTGNPSGGGRWNNEEDDGYDDYNDGVYEPVRTVSTYSGPSQFQLRQNQLHNDRLDAQDRDAILHAYNNNKERQELHGEIRRLESRIKEIAYVGKSDYVAREYFSEESYEALLDTILRPLAETCHKIMVMKKDDKRGSNMVNVMQYPKLSKDDHILITEGYKCWSGGKYLFKSDWSDVSEDIKLVDPSWTGWDRHKKRLETITVEDLQIFRDKKQEFLSLLEKREEEITRVFGYYTLFNGEEWLHHTRFEYNPDWQSFHLSDHKHVARSHVLERDKYKPTFGPLKDISDVMAKDVLELEGEIEKLKARLAEIKAAYEKDVAKYSGNSW